MNYDNFPKIIQKVRNQTKIITKKQLKSVDEFLKHAEEDEKIAVFCFNEKLFSNCAFHLQQATEKTLKAFILSYGLKNETDLKKKYSHNIQKLLEDLSELDGVKEFIEELAINEKNFGTRPLEISKELEESFNVNLEKIKSDEINKSIINFLGILQLAKELTPTNDNAYYSVTVRYNKTLDNGDNVISNFNELFKQQQKFRQSAEKLRKEVIANKYSTTITRYR
jgi:HEPN domain-containing protein